MKDSLRILKNNLFKNHKYHGTSNSIKHQIFLDTQLATIIGGFWISLNYPILNFKKIVCPKMSTYVYII